MKERYALSAQKQFAFVLFAILLALSNLFSLDIYVSAFPEIQSAFNTSEKFIAWSLSIFFIGSVTFLLLYGSASDRFGRKPVLLVGLIIYFIGNVGCIFSTTIEMFLVSRFIQAAGVCSAFVLWQPMVLDLYSKEDVQKIFSIVMPVLGISPALGPLFGGALTQVFGWNSIFIFLIILNVILIFWTLFGFKESLDSSKGNMVSMYQAYRILFWNRKFMSMSAVLALSICIYIVFVSLAPFILARNNFTPLTIGLSFIPTALVFGAGGAVAKFLSDKYGELATVRLGLVGLVLGSMLFLSIQLVYSGPIALELIVPFMVVTLFIGIIMPTGSSWLIKEFEFVSGACSSANNFIWTLLAFLVTGSSASLFVLLNDVTIGYTAVVYSMVSLIVLHFGARNVSIVGDAKTM